MASIILPPIPPRPVPAVRPTMTPTPETPGNKGVKVIMIQGPGTEPGPQPEPPKPLAVAEGKGANWVGTNVYEIGQTVEGRTAEYEGGVEPVTYRYRFQTKAAGSDSWVNQSWTNTTNAKNPVFFEITEAGQLKLQSQARDSSDPTVQLNSVTGIKTIQPQTTIGEVSVTINDIEYDHVTAPALTILLNDPMPVVVSITGDASPTYSYSARSDYPLMVGSQTASTVLTFPQEGVATVTCTLRDSSSEETSTSVVMNFFVVNAKDFAELNAS